MLANANRDRKKKPTPFRPADFNPYLTGRQAHAEREKRNVAIKVNDISILKRVFVDNRVSRVTEKT